MITKEKIQTIYNFQVFFWLSDTHDVQNDGGFDTGYYEEVRVWGNRLCKARHNVNASVSCATD